MTVLDVVGVVGIVPAPLSHAQKEHPKAQPIAKVERNFLNMLTPKKVCDEYLFSKSIFKRKIEKRKPADVMFTLESM